jgi:ketosteroid isomerase-like protein
MGSANLDLVRSIYADWERGDFTLVEWAHPEIAFTIVGGPSPESWTGLAELAEGWRDWPSAWEKFRVEAEEYRELDDERVVVLTRLSGRGKTSGVDLSLAPAQGAHVFSIRDGKVTRFVAYWDRGRALADLGLAPQGDAA